MSIVIVDTNVVSFLMKKHSLAAAYRQHLEGQTVGISFMTVGELLEGAYRAGWDESKLSRLRGILRGYVVVPFSASVCEHWARIRAERKHSPIAVDDAWIAATARACDCPLVTHNPEDFRAISGLRVVSEHRANASE